MVGDRLATAKRALGALVGRLAPTDRLGVVAFDDVVDVVVPNAPLAQPGATRAAIAHLFPGGMTNLSGALLRGLQEVRRGGGGAGRGGATLVLLTDGHANVGITDPDALQGVARKARADGTR